MASVARSRRAFGAWLAVFSVLAAALMGCGKDPPSSQINPSDTECPIWALPGVECVDGVFDPGIDKPAPVPPASVTFTLPPSNKGRVWRPPVTMTSSSSSSSSSTSSSGDTGGSGGMGGSGGNAGGGGAGGAGSGGDPGTGGGATSSSSSSSSSSSTSSSSSGGPVTFSVGPFVRDLGFDALTIGGNHLERALGIAGSAGDKYVAVSTNDMAGIAHWDGNIWSIVADTTSLPGNPTVLNDLKQVGDQFCAVGKSAATATGIMVCGSVASGWTQIDVPFAKEFKGLWASDSKIFLMGWLAAGYKIWEKPIVGGVWSVMTFPALGGGAPYELNAVWGIDNEHVVATGFIKDPQTSEAVQGLLLGYDGAIWSSIPLPATCRELVQVHGTSIAAFYATGRRTDSNAGAVYQVDWSDGFPPTVTEILMDAEVDSGYGPIWSPGPGAFLAAGYHNPSGDGSARITVRDPTGSSTTSIDGIASNPTAVGYSDGFVHLFTSAGSLQPAGLYLAVTTVQ